jgi:uncharacterized membrane protein (TIGR02234 family)
VTTDRRTYVAALALVAVGAVLALLATQAVWVRTTTASFPITAPGGATAATVRVVVESKGTEVASVVVATALVALAGLVAVVATRGWLRRLVGVLLVVAGLAVVVVSVRVLADPSAVTGQQIQPPTVVLDQSVTAWPVLAALGGVLVVAGGVVVVWRGAGWAGMAARYDAPAGTAAERPGDTWAAFDRGEDPTADPSPGRPSEDDLP